MGLNPGPRRGPSEPLVEPRTEADWLDWVPASALRNWCEGDLVLDWLDLYGDSHGFRRDDELPGYDPRFDLGSYLAEQGRRFEAWVLERLAERWPVTRVADRYPDVRSRDAVLATYEAIARGDPVIAGATLRDPATRTYGRVDLLLRVEVLAALSPDALAGDPETFPWAPEAHYRVVEVKFGTLTFLKDGRLSSGEHLAAMAQLWAYNRMLGAAQGLTPPAAYLLGRAWRQGDERGGGDPFARLGRLDDAAAVRDGPLAEIVEEAASWVRRVRTEGAEWRVLPVPSVPELWPNLKRDRDAPWRAAKREIAERLADLTLLWRVGAAHRERAHREGVTRWDDPRCTPELLGLGGEHGETLGRILAANRPGAPPVQPRRITADEERWRGPAACELYVDFETVSDLAEDFDGPRRAGETLIFQIGCGRMEDGEWRFRQFTADALSAAAELAMLEAWFAYLESLARERRLAPLADIRLFHWSPAETGQLVSNYRSAQRRHPERTFPELGWYDVLERVIRAEPVIVHGAFGFGLKAVAKALHRHGLIATSWLDGPADGAGAMAGAFTAAREARGRGVRLSDVAGMTEIARYNEVDCKVMAEVLAYLRRNH